MPDMVALSPLFAERNASPIAASANNSHFLFILAFVATIITLFKYDPPSLLASPAQIRWSGNVSVLTAFCHAGEWQRSSKVQRLSRLAFRRWRLRRGDC